MSDPDKLKGALVDFLKIPDDANFAQHPVVIALQANHINGFDSNLLTLSEEEISNLHYPAKDGDHFTDWVPSPIPFTRQLLSLVGWHHFCSRAINGPCNILETDPSAHD